MGSGNTRAARVLRPLFKVLRVLRFLSFVRAQGNGFRKHARGMLRSLINMTSYDLSVETKLLASISAFCQVEEAALCD